MQTGQNSSVSAGACARACDHRTSQVLAEMRGETAKMLVTLAVHGLNKDFYAPAQELMQLGGDTKRFGRACGCIAVRIAQVEEEHRQKTRTVLSKPHRLRIAQELVQPYRFIAEIEAQAEKQMEHINIYLFDSEDSELQRVRVYETRY